MQPPSPLPTPFPTPCLPLFSLRMVPFSFSPSLFLLFLLPLLSLPPTCMHTHTHTTPRHMFHREGGNFWAPRYLYEELQCPKCKRKHTQQNLLLLLDFCQQSANPWRRDMCFHICSHSFNNFAHSIRHHMPLFVVVDSFMCHLELWLLVAMNLILILILTYIGVKTKTWYWSHTKKEMERATQPLLLMKKWLAPIGNPAAASSEKCTQAMSTMMEYRAAASSEKCTQAMSTMMEYRAAASSEKCTQAMSTMMEYRAAASSEKCTQAMSTLWWNTEQQHPQCTQAMSTMMEYRAAASSEKCTQAMSTMMEYRAAASSVYMGNVHHDGIQSSRILREVYTGNVHHDGIQSSSILREVYTGNVHSVVEYRAAVRATATKSNTSRQVKVQNKGMHMIIEGLKPTPTLTMETATRLPSLDLCHEDKMTRRKSPHPHWENQKTEWSPSQTSSTAHKEHYDKNQLQPSCQTSHKIPCWDLASQPSRETWCRWLEMPDARCALLYRSARSYNKKPVNMIQPARLANRKCWIGTTTHHCGLMSTQIDPLMQLSETAGEGSISTLATGKYFQHCWLLVYCQTTRAELTAL